MVKIRLTRRGARNRAYYKIVAIDERKPRDSRPLEFLGSYDPSCKPEKLTLDPERLDAWVANGAQLSPTVRSLVRRARRHAAAAAGAR